MLKIYLDTLEMSCFKKDKEKNILFNRMGLWSYQIIYYTHKKQHLDNYGVHMTFHWNDIWISTGIVRISNFQIRLLTIDFWLLT